MGYSIFGLMLLLVPFVLVRFFKDTVNGLVTILTIVFSIHVLVALLSQSLAIFTYPILIGIHSCIALLSLYIFYRKNKNNSNTASDIKIGYIKKCIHVCKHFSIQNWFLIGISILGIFLLYSIRFNYTGEVDTAFGIKHVTSSSYTYPLYSDEWVGSSLVNYSIQEKALPLVNPLFKNEPFINFLMASHSLFAEIILVLALNPFSQYIYLAICNSVLLCICVFLSSKLLHVRNSIALISAISVLFLTNSGNLPGTWFLLPYTASLTVFLFSIIGYQLKNKIVLFINLSLSLLLYPPMIVFILPLLFGMYFENRIKNIINKKFFLFYTLTALVASLSIVLLLIIKNFSFVDLFTRAVSFIFRESLDSGKVSFDVWNIIPFYILPFVPFGIYALYKDKRIFLLSPIAIGIVFWIYYFFSKTVFIIEPSRIIIITSVLFLIAGGLGMERMYTYVSIRNNFEGDIVLLNGIKVLVLLFFTFFTFNFSKFALWHKLPLQTQIRGENRSFVPAPPITRYLHKDDLMLFKNYSKSIFISPPWKGLVIGTMTGNYPLDSKASTLTNQRLLYVNFMSENCENKKKLIKKYMIDLVYATSIVCPEILERIGASSEGIILYKTL